MGNMDIKGIYDSFEQAADYVDELTTPETAGLLLIIEEKTGYHVVLLDSNCFLINHSLPNPRLRSNI